MSGAPNNGGPAFPFATETQIDLDRPGRSVHSGPIGITLRDYFAGKAMEALIVSSEEPQFVDVAADAFGFADAMLEARSQ